MPPTRHISSAVQLASLSIPDAGCDPFGFQRTEGLGIQLTLDLIGDVGDGVKGKRQGEALGVSVGQARRMGE